MELNFKSAFFWPYKRTIVRTIKFSATLTYERAIFRVLWHVSPKRTVERARRLLLTPPQHSFSDAEFAVLEEASLVSVPLASGRLVGWRWGHVKDPVVLLVHGWGGRGAQLKSFIEPLLARGFSVVAYDAPGHGMTGGGESSLPHMLQGLNAMLDYLGSVQAIIGHSVGGAVAAMAIAKRPEIKCGVLIASPASLTASTQRIADALGWPELMRVAVQRRIENHFGVKWSEFEAEQSSGVTPIMVIHDRQDREVPFNDGLRHAAAWPRGRLLETNGLGHRRMLSDSKVVLATADFIAGENS